jgi:dTDP-glucose 4,6-dehydratase
MRLRDGRAVPAFMSQALRDEDVTVFGDGTQTRSFCYISDLVDGILRLLESDTHDPVNIGNPHEVTIEQIARTIISLVGSKSRIVYRPLPQDDPKQRKPDITRAQTILGWQPKIGLEEGLAKTVGYFKSKLEAEAR